MPYVERVTKAGNTIEIERYFTSRYKKKGISRGDKVKPTKEEQEKVNTRQAERKLRILINANYGYGDYHLVLDYIRRKGESDRTPEQMRQDIDVFLRECRKEYRKAGLEFKYIRPLKIGYDRYSAQYLITDMANYGFHMDDVYQGENLTPVIREFEGIIKDGDFKIADNNLLKTHFLNVALKHNMETRKFRPIKIEQRAHIDGFVSVIDAMTVRQKYWEECGELLKNAA